MSKYQCRRRAHRAKVVVFALELLREHLAAPEPDAQVIAAQVIAADRAEAALALDRISFLVGSTSESAQRARHQTDVLRSDEVISLDDLDTWIRQWIVWTRIWDPTEPAAETTEPEGGT